MTDHSSNPTPNLQDQVASAHQALEQQAKERATHHAGPSSRPPADRRLVAAISLGAFVVVLALNLGSLQAPAVDAEAELDATIAAIEVTRRAVQAHWDSEGAPPASLAPLGLDALPLTYTASATQFRISAPSPFDSDVGYQSETRPSPAGTR